MPPPVRPFLSKGFSQLAELPPVALDAIAGSVSRWLDPRYPPPKTATVAGDLGVDDSRVNSVIGAVTFQATMLFSSIPPMPADVFVSEAVDATVLEAQHAAAVQAFADDRLYPCRSAIHDALVRAQSSTRVVSSFESFEVAVDFRMANDADSRLLLMPMAVAVLRTDVADQHLVFQMTPRDAHQLRERLESLIQQFESYEQMTQQEVSKRG